MRSHARMRKGKKYKKSIKISTEKKRENDERKGRKGKMADPGQKYWMSESNCSINNSGGQKEAC